MTRIAFGFDNQSAVTASTGTLRFDGGGISGSTSQGSFTASAGARVEFSSGLFDADRWDLAGTIAFNGATVHAARLNGPTADATLAYSEVSISDSSTGSVLKHLAMSSGTLSGQGALTATDGLRWTDGTMSGSGETYLPAGSESSIEADYSVALSGRTLRNAGVLTWSAGSVDGSNAAQIVNSGTWHANSQKASGLNNIGGTSTFRNTGTVDKTDGTGLTRIAYGFDNQSAVTASTGTLRFDGGGISGSTSQGSFTASASGSRVEFSSGLFDADRWDLAGTIAFNGATVHAARLNGPTADTSLAYSEVSISDTTTGSVLKHLTMSSGTLSGQGKLTATDGWRITDGSLVGSGTLVLPPGSDSVIDADYSILVNGWHIENYEHVAWNNGRVQTANAASITNFADARFEANAEQGNGMSNISGAQSVFRNHGWVGKTQGNGETKLGPQFDNINELEAEQGRLSLGGGTPPGDARNSKVCAPKDGSSIVITGGDWNYGDTQWCGDIKIAGGNVTAASIQQKLHDGQPTNPLADVDISSGTLTLTSTTEETQLRSLTMSGGNLSGTGTANVYDRLTWTDGTMNGPGTTHLGPLATSTISPDYSVGLVGRRLVNDGTVTWSSGRIEGSNAAQITNTGTWHANSGANSGLNHISGAASTFINTGTLDKTAGANTTRVGYQLENAGVISAAGGVLRFDGGGTPAPISVPEPPASPACIPNPPNPDHGIMTTTGTGEIEMGAGCYTLGTGSTMTARLSVTGANVTIYDPDELSGGLAVSSGSFAIKTPWTLADFDTLTIDGGLVENPGDIACKDEFHWRGGLLAGSGTNTIADTCTGTIEPGVGGNVVFSGQTVSNQGTLSWQSGGFRGGQAARLLNYGTFRANSEDASGMTYDGGVRGMLPLLANWGVIEKTTGAGQTHVGFAVSRRGTVITDTGDLAFDGRFNTMMSEVEGPDETPETTPEDILMPDGEPIGDAYEGDETIRKVPGGMTEAEDLFLEVAQGGHENTPEDLANKGILVEIEGWGTINFRWESSGGVGDPAIDVKMDQIPFKRIHFNG